MYVGIRSKIMCKLMYACCINQQLLNLNVFNIVFSEIFSGKVLLHDDSETTTESLKGNILGLYFSAHWVGNCSRMPAEYNLHFYLIQNLNFELLWFEERYNADLI